MPRALPQRKRRAGYGEAIAWARAKLARDGYVVPWQLTAEGFRADHVLKRLADKGEAIQLFGSTAYMRPDVAAKIEALVAQHKTETAEAAEE